MRNGEFFKFIRVRNKKKKLETNVWSLDVGQTKNFFFQKTHVLAVGGHLFWIIPIYVQIKVYQVGKNYIWKTSVWSTKKIENKIDLGKKMPNICLMSVCFRGGTFISHNKKMRNK